MATRLHIFQREQRAEVVLPQVKLVLTIVLAFFATAQASPLCPPGTGLARNDATGGGKCEAGGVGDLTTVVPTIAAAIVAPTPQPTFAYTPPTPQPTYAYTAPTPQPTYAAPAAPTPMSATYDPASLAANTARCDTLTVTGAVTSRPILPMPQTTPAPGCVMSAPPRVSAANTVVICWRNAFSATTACDTTSSPWLFTQP